MPLGRPVRRSSWLTEVQSSQQRKYSFGGASLTSTSPQPTTPSVENGQYDTSSTSRAPAGGTSFPWHTQVWQKDRAPRLAEVLPSQPTSLTEWTSIRNPIGTSSKEPPIAILFRRTGATCRYRQFRKSSTLWHTCEEEHWSFTSPVATEHAWRRSRHYIGFLERRRRRR